MKTFLLNKIIDIEEGYNAAVDIGFSLYAQNEEKLNAYIPTSRAITALGEIGKALAPNWAKRARFITGQYGTGKSHLGLVVANIFKQSADTDAMVKLVEKLRKKNKEVGETFVRARWRGNIRWPFLVVIPDTQRDNFDMALLAALELALEQADIDYEFKTYFQEALPKLEEILQDTELEKRFVIALRKHGKTIEMLQNGLEKFRKKDFNLFVEVVREITKIEFVPKAHAKAGPVFLEAAKLLRTMHSYSGIIVIADEFGKHLTTMAKNLLSAESIVIQKFAQACNESRENQVHFIAIAHKTLADYKPTAADDKDWKKVAGRFTEHNLDYARGQEEEIVDLINAVILQKEGTKTQKEYWNMVEPFFGTVLDWVKNTGLYNNQSINWRRVQLIEGCYPLHPGTVFCLPWLSQRLGQAERTAFSFLATNVDGSLVRFISSTPVFHSDNLLNIYTPEMLLDFFGPAARDHEQYISYMRAYDEAYSRCGDEEIADRILKIITVLKIAGQPKLQAKENEIISILGRTVSEKTEIKNVLEQLRLNGLIRLHPQLNIYEIPKRSEGDLPPREAIDQLKTKWMGEFDHLAEIRRLYSVEEIKATGYIKEKNIHRKAKVELVSADHLGNLLSPMEEIKTWYKPGQRTYRGDVLLWYVIAVDKGDITRAMKALENGTKSEQHIVAVPKLPLPHLDELWDLAAIRKIHKYGRKVGERTVEVEQLQVVEEIIKTQVEDGLQDYFGANNFHWFHGKNRNGKLKAGEEDKLLSRILLDLFQNTPSIMDAAVIHGKISGPNNRARRNAISTLIGVHGGALQIKKSGGSAENRILRSVLLNNEVCEKVNDLGQEIEIEVRENVPKKSKFFRVWTLIDNALAREDVDIVFGELIRNLLNPPYGLPRPLIELLLGAYFRCIRGNFQIINKSGSIIEPSEKLILDIVKNPDNYVLIYYKFTPPQRVWLEGIVKLLPKVDLPDVGLLEQARDALVEWFGKLPSGTRTAQDHEQHVKNILLLLNKDKDNTDHKEFLLELLPQSLGFTKIGFTLEDVENMLSALQEIIETSDNHIQIRAQEANEILCEIFDAFGKTHEDLARAMNNWWSHELESSQRLRIHKMKIQALANCIKQGELDEQRILVELPQSMKHDPYTSWTDSKDVLIFTNDVSHAKQIIESYNAGGTDMIGVGGTTKTEVSLADLRDRINALFDKHGLKSDERIELLTSLLKNLKQ